MHSQSKVIGFSSLIETEEQGRTEFFHTSWPKILLDGKLGTSYLVMHHLGLEVCQPPTLCSPHLSTSIGFWCQQSGSSDTQPRPSSAPERNWLKCILSVQQRFISRKIHLEIPTATKLILSCHLFGCFSSLAFSNPSTNKPHPTPLTSTCQSLFCPNLFKLSS